MIYLVFSGLCQLNFGVFTLKSRAFCNALLGRVSGEMPVEKLSVQLTPLADRITFILRREIQDPDVLARRSYGNGKLRLRRKESGKSRKKPESPVKPSVNQS